MWDFGQDVMGSKIVPAMRESDIKLIVMVSYIIPHHSLMNAWHYASLVYFN